MPQGYVLIVGMFIYKTITLKDALKCFKGSNAVSSSIMALFSIVGIFSWLIAVEEVGKTQRRWLSHGTSNRGCFCHY